MISSLTGILKAKFPDRAEITVGGVGFLVSIPLSTFRALPELSEEVTFLTHLHLRENGVELIGFSRHLERQVFEMLIAVSGIGIKTALAILSGIETNGLIQSILAEDKAVLSSIPGVGPKTAGRVILELKEKIVKLSPALDSKDRGEVTVIEEAIRALETLGYTRYEARRAVELAIRQTGKDQPSEVLIREALKAAI